MDSSRAQHRMRRRTAQPPCRAPLRHKANTRHPGRSRSSGTAHVLPSPTRSHAGGPSVHVDMLIHVLVLLVAAIGVVVVVAAVLSLAVVVIVAAAQQARAVVLLVVVLLLSRPLRLQRQVAHEPRLVAVHEHLAAAVELHAVRHGARGARPVAMRHQRRRILRDTEVEVDDGARAPRAVVVGLVLDGARDAIADAEAALLGGRRRRHLRQAVQRKPQRFAALAKADVGADRVIVVL
eukprot:4305739-Prymnesium_polylepis.2